MAAQDPIALLVRRSGTRTNSTMPGCSDRGRDHGALERAVAFAEASPFPLPEQATDDVFAA